MVKHKIDTYDALYILVIVTCVTLGLVMIYSSSHVVAAKSYDDGWHYLKKQLVFALVGVLLFFVAANVNYRAYKKLSFVFLLIAILVNLLLLTGLGVRVGGAKRWLSIAGIGFQPSNLIYFAYVNFLATSLSTNEKIKTFSRGFLPYILMLGVVSVLLLAQSDLGSVVLLAIVTCVMLFVSGARIRYALAGFIAALPFLYVFIFNVPYRRARILSFLDPFADISNKGFQLIQSFMAFRRGGFLGQGIGEGWGKLFYLPELHTDFIFSHIGEELGFLGVFCIICMMLYILYYGFKASVITNNTYAKFLALAIVTLFGLQVVINTFMVLGLIPTKGMGLPLFSYGGSSLLMYLFMLGIVMNIKINAR